MNFAEAARNIGQTVRTENGALAYNTTTNSLLDLFSVVGALRKADNVRIETKFAEAYIQNPTLTMKILFYARDIRGGLGERNTFRVALKWLATHYPDSVIKNLEHILYYGRGDDYYALIGTPVEFAMWNFLKTQMQKDLAELGKPNGNVSLLGKWLKSTNTHNIATKKFGKLTASKLGYKNEIAYRKDLVKLRKAIKIVESQMSSGDWANINYEHVPSRAAMIYRKAFGKHDQERYGKYITDALAGKANIHSDTLYPYDLIDKYVTYGWGMGIAQTEDSTIEAQWKQLPDYIEKGQNAMVVADMSGSMNGRPMSTSLGLAIYFAERNTGPYQNLFMSFSGESDIQILRGATLLQKIRGCNFNNWGQNTNLEKAFAKVLAIAIKNNIPKEEMIKTLLVISDMEIDQGSQDTFFYDNMKNKYEAYGYTMPNTVFWNVNSRQDTYLIDDKRPNTVLISGQSASTFKHLVGLTDKTPHELMLEVLNSDRYARVIA